MLFTEDSSKVASVYYGRGLLQLVIITNYIVIVRTKDGGPLLVLTLAISVATQYSRLGYVGLEPFRTARNNSIARIKILSLYKSLEDYNLCRKSKSTYYISKELTKRPDLPRLKLNIDTIGPITTTRVNRERYTIVLTNGAIRTRYVYTTLTKTEITSILRNYITLLSNNLSRKLKVLRIDNGTENSGKALEEAYTSKGI